MADPSEKRPINELFQEFRKPYVRLLGYLRPHRFRFALGILFGIAFGLVNGCLPVVIQQASAVIFGGQSEVSFLRDWLHVDKISKPGLIAIACLLIPFAMILRGLFSFLNRYFVEWVSLRVLIDLRDQLLRRVLKLSLDFFNTAKTGQLISRITNDTREAQGVLNTMSTDLVAQPISLIAGIVVLLNMDWKFTVVTLFLFPLCLVPVIIIGRKIRQAAKREYAETAEVLVILQEIISGIKVVKSFSRSEFELTRFNRSSEDQFRDSMHVKKAMESTTPIVEGIASLGIGLALFYVYYSKLPGPTFVALAGGIYLLYQPVKTLSRLHLLLIRCLNATTSVFELMDLKPAVRDPESPVVLKECKGDITFSNVAFSYRKDIAALSDVSFHFNPGKYYALVGASGAGKSTMLSLMMRFYDPVSGAIFLDGHDLRDFSQDGLRENIGVVTQDTFLFHESIAKNIAYGRLDATREEIMEAAKLAYAHDFIMAQPRGYDTVIGDKGCMLSGGQQQRIAIARALLKNAPVLLLDEATSALDSESEKQIQSALEILSHGKTVIAIAHRLSTILKADQIIVLDQGEIKEIGTHQELLRKSGFYSRLYHLQFSHHHPDIREDQNAMSELSR